jgi:hypothetical protein
MQLQRVAPELRQERFSSILDFEGAGDALFVATEPTRAMVTAERAHTGQFGVRLPSGTRRMSIDLPTLLSGRPFPGEWTLVGLYLFSAEPVSVTMGYEVNGRLISQRRQQLVGGQWTGVRMDITSVQDAAKGAGRQPAGATDAATGQLVLSFDEALDSPMWCDDVLLMDNSRTLVTSPQWSIRQHGFAWVLEAPRHFKLTLKTPEASDEGWALEEANALRARFRCDSADSAHKYWIIYADGRQYVDGAYDGLLVRSDPYNETYEREHLEPAAVSVPEGMGRVQRNSAGDERNSGYNQRTGAYQVLANGPRVQVTLTPSAACPNLVRPVLEVAGMPAGKVLATLDGRLIETTARLPEGQVLVEVPLRIERAATIDLRVE